MSKYYYFIKYKISLSIMKWKKHNNTEMIKNKYDQLQKYSEKRDKIEKVIIESE